MPLVTVGLGSPQLILTGGLLGAASASISLEEAIVLALEASPSVVALVGARVYPIAVPQSSTAGGPALCYRIATAKRPASLTGPGGLARIAVAFEVTSGRHADLPAVREATRNLFQGVPGSPPGIQLLYTSVVSEADSYAPAPAGSDLGTHTKTFTVRYTIRERAPTHT